MIIDPMKGINKIMETIENLTPEQIQAITESTGSVIVAVLVTLAMITVFIITTVIYAKATFRKAKARKEYFDSLTNEQKVIIANYEYADKEKESKK